MTRITLFEAPEDEAAFEDAWRSTRAPTGARLLRSHAPSADFRFAELAGDDVGPPSLPARSASAVYRVVVDDLPPDASLALVFINPYEVPPSEDDAEFERTWTALRDRVTARDGYVGSHLYRSVDDSAEFRYVNVSPWAHVDGFTAAVADPSFALAARSIYHRAHPSLYLSVA